MVIAVPAYFGLAGREATRKAGEIAGLNVVNVLAEPVAAALNYQVLGEGAEVRHILVYDLGGGTFDTTVIRIDGDDVHVICTDGDHHLGGADWDSAIGDFLLRGFTEQYPQLDPGGDEQFMQELAIVAEQLKKALSAVMARKHNVRFDGSVARLELTREHFEELTSELAWPRTVISLPCAQFLVGRRRSQPVPAQAARARRWLSHAVAVMRRSGCR